MPTGLVTTTSLAGLTQFNEAAASGPGFGLGGFGLVPFGLRGRIPLPAAIVGQVTTTALTGIVVTG